MKKFLGLLLCLSNFYVVLVNAMRTTPPAKLESEAGYAMKSSVDEWLDSLPTVEDQSETDSEILPSPMSPSVLIKNCHDICPICPLGAYYFGKYTDGQLAHMREKGRFKYFPACDNCFPDVAMRNYLHESAMKEIDAAVERTIEKPVIAPEELARLMAWAGKYWEGNLTDAQFSMNGRR